MTRMLSVEIAVELPTMSNDYTILERNFSCLLSSRSQVRILAGSPFHLTESTHISGIKPQSWRNVLISFLIHLRALLANGDRGNSVELLARVLRGNFQRILESFKIFVGNNCHTVELKTHPQPSPSVALRVAAATQGTTSLNQSIVQKKHQIKKITGLLVQRPAFAKEQGNGQTQH